MILKKIVSRLFKDTLRVNLEILVSMTQKLGKASMLWDILSQVYQQKSNNLCQYRLTPKYSEAFSKSEVRTNTDGKELAIVIQGPIDNEFDFTIETVKIYKKLFPNSYIIISSWKDMPSEKENELKSLGCYVLLSDYPKPMGYFHLNYQVLSTMVGLKKAKELGAKYCIKNRSDLRINKYQSFEYLKSLLEVFPLKGNEIPLKGRIISLSGWRGQMFYPFWIQDYMYFGYTDDLINLFEIPMDDRDIPNSSCFTNGENRIKTGKEFTQTLSPEMYITYHFTKKYIHIDDLSVRQSWDIVQKYFIIMNFEDLNIIWKKHGRFSLNEILMESDGKTMYTDPYRIFTFSDFVNLYTGQMDYRIEYENMREKLPF